MQVDGYSLDAQRDKLRKYAAYEDMVVAGEYSDEGFSGKNIQGRQEFQRMLNDIQDCKDGVSYVLVFKLSRFGRNAADVLNSLQLMQDFGVNLICVEDGIDSSKDAGKLMISVLSAVAEIERENIRTQTMAGREQKAREGKWNGGFAPYGYKLESGNLVIAEDEVEVIRVIYDRYIHTNEGVAGVAKYLNRNGFVKKLRQNNTIPGFSRNFVQDVLDNPVYMGKIAYGRRRTEKRQGTRNEMHVVEQSEFPVYDGQHEAIISEEDWYLAQEITEKYEDQARQLRQADQEKAARDAQQDQRRAQSGADRTRREQLLACKQQLIDDTFRQARQQLTQLPREKYVQLLVQLAVKNGAGTEEIILSPEDAPLGQQVLEGANAQGRHFRLSAEQRPTGGGLILKQGSVECSCTFPEILRQLRQEMSGEVAAILFD